MMPFQKAFLNSPEIGRHLELPNCVIHYHEQERGAALGPAPRAGILAVNVPPRLPRIVGPQPVVSVDLRVAVIRPAFPARAPSRT
jgi:hypothetical protein